MGLQVGLSERVERGAESRLDKELANPLANCLNKVKQEHPENPLFKQLVVPAVKENNDPRSSQTILDYNICLKEENHGYILKRITSEISPALEEHQRSCAGRIARILLNMQGALSDGLDPNSNKVQPDNLLTKRDFKKLKTELKEELAGIGLKKPMINLYSIESGRHANNLILVQVEFDSSHYPKLNKIRQRFKQLNGSVGKLSSINIQFSRKLAVIVRSHKNQIPKKIGLNDSNGAKQMKAARLAEELLNTNKRCIEDWRGFPMIGIDSLGTTSPEDIHAAVFNPDGSMILRTAFPSHLSEQKFYQNNLQVLSCGIENQIMQDGSFKPLKAKLIFTQLSDWMSCEKADSFLQVSRSFKGKVNKDDVGLFNSFNSISNAVHLTAAAGYVKGLPLKNAFKSDGEEAELELAADGIVSQLIVMNQRALAIFLCERNMPIIIRRAKNDFYDLKDDIKRIFGCQADSVMTVLTLSDHGRLAVMDLLRAKQEFEISDLIGSRMIQAHLGSQFKWMVVSSIDELEFFDRAPFKPGHGQIPALINQLQLTSLSLCRNDMAFSVKFLESICGSLNKDYAISQASSMRNDIEKKTTRLKRIIYSRIPRQIHYAGLH